MAVDLWGDISLPGQIKSPIYLLKEQAAALRQKTEGAVQVDLDPGNEPEGQFSVGFNLFSPALGNYRYHLFTVTYPPEYYPLRIHWGGEMLEAHGEDTFRQHLSTVLGSPRTTQIVQAILAQATALQTADESS